MCQFLSLDSNGRGKIMYFDALIRKKILAGETDFYAADSHASIARHFGMDEDKLNKYGYNPLTGKFTVDQINARDDREEVERFCNELDLSAVVPELVIKPVINPFRSAPPEITTEYIGLLARWASVRDSVWDSVGASVWASVRDSVWDSVGASVWDSVRDSVRDSVGASVGVSVRDSVGASVGVSVRDSVGASVWDSVGASVWDSVWGYTGSFFGLPRDLWKYTEGIETEGYPFSPAVELWEAGLVPGFDGKTWRLHGGPSADVLFEITKEELAGW